MFFWNSLAFLWSNRCRQFDFWFFCLFLIQLEHLKFLVHVPVKPSLKDFEHNLASMWNEHIVRQFEHSLALPFFGIRMKTDLFQSYGHCWVLQICQHIKCSTLTASSFRILNNLSGILSPPLAFFIVMLPKAHLTSHSKMSGSMWMKSSRE